MIVIWTILLEIITYYRATWCNERHGWTYSLVSYYATIIWHDFGDGQNFGTSDLLDFFLVILGEPFVIERSHTFKV